MILVVVGCLRSNGAPRSAPGLYAGLALEACLARPPGVDDDHILEVEQSTNRFF
jgi:hypothetical protein